MKERRSHNFVGRSLLILKVTKFEARDVGLKPSLRISTKKKT